MALSEDEIALYGRQILLRELGGRGQELLLRAAVKVVGTGPGIAEAITWLNAGGTPLDASAQIELLPYAEHSSAPHQVVIGAGVAYRCASACDDCWTWTKECLGELPPAPLAGPLAALVVQRLILGWSEPLGLIAWTGVRFETRHPVRCSAHRSS